MFIKISFSVLNDILKLLDKNLQVDLFKGYTNAGVHRDDFEIYINDNLLNIYGSQGQHRTAILSLKIAEMEILKEEVGENPVLLLDDVTSELDLERIKLIPNVDETIAQLTKEIEATTKSLQDACDAVNIIDKWKY